MNTMLSPKPIAFYAKTVLIGLFAVAFILPGNAQAATLGSVSVSLIETNEALVTVSVQRNSQSARVWVEYGTTSSFGEKTTTYNISEGSGSKIIERQLKSLRPGTLYYLRVVIQNKQGQTITSGVQTFRTLGATTSTPTTSPSSSGGTSGSSTGGTTTTRKSSGFSLFDLFGSGNDEEETRSTGAPRFTGGSSPFTKGYQTDYAPGRVNGASTDGLFLEVVSVNNSRDTNSSLMTLTSGDENAVEGSDTGDILSWSVMYRNLSSSELSNAGMKITIPSDVEIVSVSKTPTRIDGKVLFYDLGTLPVGAQESIELRTRVKETATIGNTLIFSSIFQYRDANNRTQSITSYMTTLVKGVGVTEGIKNNLFAAIGDFFTSLWLVVLILFLSAAYLLYRYRMNVKNIESRAVDTKPNPSIPAPVVKPAAPVAPSGPPRSIDEMNLPGFKVNGTH